MSPIVSRIIFILLFLLSIFFVCSAQAERDSPLPVEQAFVFSAYSDTANQLVADWHVAPGYFLYRDKLHIRVISGSSTRLGPIVWPTSKNKLDPNRGSFRAYDNHLHLIIPLLGHSHHELSLLIQYQGCSQQGFCYAPMKKVVDLSYPFTAQGLHNAPLLTISNQGSSEIGSPDRIKAIIDQNLITDQKAVKAYLSHHTFILTLLCFLGLGLLLAFTPCSLPMIPILSSIIMGQQNLTLAKAGYCSLMYVLGMALTYALAGVAIAWLGSSVQIYFQNPWVISGLSLLFALLALSMLGLFELRLPRAWQQSILSFSQKQKGGTYLGAFLMGSFSTLIVSPCVTAPLVGVLAYITETGNMVFGGLALFALGLGMGLPLLLLGFSVGQYLPQAGPWMEVIKKLLGFLLLGLAIEMLSRILPSGLILFLWASLLIVIAVFFFFVEGLTSFWRYVAYVIAILLVVYGFALFVGVAMDYTSPWYPFEKWAMRGDQAIIALNKTKNLNFVDLRNMDQLKATLKKAKQERRPVMLDFYAQWCESCRALEKTVLNQPEVKNALKRFILVRADVTEDNAFHQALFKKYHVIAPPTFLFFNRDGQEMVENRIVGEVDYKLFIACATSL